MKLAAYLLAGIGLGFAVAYWQMGDPGGSGWSSDLAIDDRAPIEQRLSELETALALERYEREVLAAEIASLEDALAAANLDAVGADPQEPAPDPRERIAALLEGEAGGPAAERLRQRFENGFAGGLDEAAREQRQIQRFVDAGFSPDRAQWIVQREDELEMQALQARYEATRIGASAAEVANLSTSRMMRQELGDADYERYLEGLGRPTTINVRDVLTNSPAQIAGLEPGDQIIAYDGQRVFDMNELTSLTYEGPSGDTVAIDVIRDGQRMQLYVERGPIGVSGGGRSLRRR